jgi:cold shock CspA family protein
MAKSQTTFSKKEKEKKKIQKRQEKQEKMAQRKFENNKGKSFEDMLAYVDENGNISDRPADPTKLVEIQAEDIGTSGYQVVHNVVTNTRKGKITYFNDQKGYGFIQDYKSQDRVFVHMSNLPPDWKLDVEVEYEIERSPKGEAAINVRRKQG